VNKCLTIIAGCLYPRVLSLRHRHIASVIHVVAHVLATAVQPWPISGRALGLDDVITYDVIVARAPVQLCEDVRTAVDGSDATAGAAILCEESEARSQR